MTASDQHKDFQRQIGDKERLKLKSKKAGKPNVWQGFSVFGLIGWSIAAPMVALVLIGIWLDEHYSNSFSFTLSMLMIGLAIGCVNAWYWVRKKMSEFEENEPNE